MAAERRTYPGVSIVAAIVIIASALGQTPAPPVVVTQPPSTPTPATPAAGAPTSAAPEQPGVPILTAEQLDQLVSPIAIYPDPLIAQILPASTYPVDIVRAARLVRSGASEGQIEQQDWDPAVKAVAH